MVNGIICGCSVVPSYVNPRTRDSLAYKTTLNLVRSILNQVICPSNESPPLLCDTLCRGGGSHKQEFRTEKSESLAVLVSEQKCLQHAAFILRRQLVRADQLINHLIGYGR